MAFAVPASPELRLVAIISHLNSCQALINDLYFSSLACVFVRDKRAHGSLQNQQDATSVEKSFRQCAVGTDGSADGSKCGYGSPGLEVVSRWSPSDGAGVTMMMKMNLTSLSGRT
uniref:Uncharacterized protein n=1 Tax=Anopheles maculatus TaxID=74869 RepID=A0A182SBG2_9DIPT